ncbi:rhodanese-like domain-containing protein [Marinobacterium jannaschii]|uniref:rhodanese-like domain-containing protein n=1 Tax=Marinobacterium jannaschii TaxID=64970 RepID=UPI00047F6905|nr:rhodanese-like domain-containing protein [Marinobacterium jannaschii]
MYQLKTGIKALVDQAFSEIETLSPAQAVALYGDDDVLFIDIRDIRELQREGRIPGSFHAPRGMLEFWADPDSPYFHERFACGKKLVLHCAKGWRSALGAKALQDMGVPRICHFDGGFSAWKELGGAIEEKQ